MSHSAVISGTSLLVFGGRDDDNNKLNDLWELSISSGVWTEIKPNNPETMPLPRAGHKCCIFEDMMFMFGGIYEITKELNDVWAFSLKSKKWILIFDEPNSPMKLGTGGILGSAGGANSPDNSPFRINSQVKKGASGGKSPTGKSPIGRNSTMKSNKKSPAKNLKLKTHGGHSPSRNKGVNIALGLNLTTPTSVSMQNSFIIKNSDSSFD